jgi:membrane-bound lytic murein transglycosylase D
MKSAARTPLLLLSSFLFFIGCSHSAVPFAEESTTGSNNWINPVMAQDPQAEQNASPVEADEAGVETEAENETDAEGDSAPANKTVLSRAQVDKNPVSIKKENGEDEESLLDTALELTESAQEYWKEDELDKAFEALDQAYALILNVPNNGNPKLIQQKEDLRFMISKRLMEMYASRHVAVKGSHNEIPLIINDHVQREIKAFQTVERDFFVESYKRSGRYRGEMVKALKEAGIPEEISWLPLIESGFKTRALSRARAFGLWQFIPSTGYKFGLKRTAWIDERLDPEKATSAAIAYMKELHQMFGDWATVLAAYNCGEGAVARVIRNQKINYLDNFWDFYERLPRETARYYPRFLATLAIIKDPAKYGFTLEEIDNPLPFEEVTIERPVHLSALADKVGVSLSDLADLNPELRQQATPNTAYALKVPPGAGEAVLASLDNMPKWSPPKVEYVVHRVRRGETLSLLALRYRTSIDKIAEANNMRKGKLLRIGQRLKIPTRTSST